MIKTILVALDGSESSESALRFALDIAAKFEARFSSNVHPASREASGHHRGPLFPATASGSSCGLKRNVKSKAFEP
jgi:nucleotide-binding universal stress UspA family protein